MKASLKKMLFTVSMLLSVLSSETFAQAQNQVDKKTAKSGKPWLGIAIDKGKKGVMIKGILPNTPAEGAGFMAGDEVLKLDGKEIKDPNELITIVQSSGIGQNIAVELLRGDKTITKTLKLVIRPDELQLLRDRLVGKPAPSFNLEVIKGKEPGDFKKLAGRVTVVEFWATWCPACRATHPRLSAFASANPSIAVVAISDEEKPALTAYAKQTDPKFTILRDAEGKSPTEWMASAIPMISVIGKDGKVAFVTVGAGEAAEEALNFALKLGN
jgi:cytochrome c biogenesis protein CcmG/thiol:disulfide interchange protein DsbE